MDERMGLLRRMIGMIFFPGKVFQALHENPAFLAPMILIAVLSAATLPLILPLNAQLVEQQLQANPNMSPEQVEQAKAMSQGNFAMAMGIVSVLVITPVMFAVYAVLFQLILNFGFGGSATFKPVLSIVTHASVITLVGLLVTIPLMLYQGQAGITLNLGLLVPFFEEEGFLYRVLKNIDVFIIWWLCLVSIGLGSLYRMPTSRPASVLFSLWVVWILLKAALAPTLSRFIPGM